MLAELNGINNKVSGGFYYSAGQSEVKQVGSTRYSAGHIEKGILQKCRIVHLALEFQK